LPRKNADASPLQLLRHWLILRITKVTTRAQEDVAAEIYLNPNHKVESSIPFAFDEYYVYVM